MPQGSSASPGRLVKVINEANKGLKQVAAYLYDVIVFDSDPTVHVEIMGALFERLRNHNFKFSKACPGAWILVFWATRLRPPVRIRTGRKCRH